MTEEPTFSVEEAVATQRALRGALGLQDERFPLPAFVGMISDEIEQMRQAGHSDDDVRAIITSTTGQTLSADQLQRFYAPPEARRRGPE